MSTRYRTVAALGLNLVSLLTACVLLAGCAAGAGSGPSPSEPAVTTAPPTTGGQPSVDAASMVLRGTMIESVEVSCRILRADDTKDTYELIGLPDELARPGTRVEVRGVVATGMVSFCMQGTIFKVSSARRV